MPAPQRRHFHHVVEAVLHALAAKPLLHLRTTDKYHLRFIVVASLFLTLPHPRLDFLFPGRDANIRAFSLLTPRIQAELFFHKISAEGVPPSLGICYAVRTVVLPVGFFSGHVFARGYIALGLVNLPAFLR